MIDLLQPIAQACDLSIPGRLHRRIAVIGAGAVVRAGHLPAYAAAGLPVVGICDRDPARADAARAAFGLRRVLTLEDVLADDTIEVVDVAVLPTEQPPIVRAALAAGKHVLAQNPLALVHAEAVDLAAAARVAGRSLVVNHQMRYSEGMAAARAIAEAGWIGEVTAVTVDVSGRTDWPDRPGLAQSPQLDLMYHSVHYFDTVRALLGSPSTVYCVAGRRPGQSVTGETRTTTTMTFASGARALVAVDHENTTGDRWARMRIDGAQGSIRVDLRAEPVTLEFSSRVLPTDGWLPYPVSTRWTPHAFAGPMRALLREIAGEATAPTTAEDAVQTSRVVAAGYASIGSGVVQLL
ncbi:Gfo/Idh/MocA family oxidoreductase [Kineosporia mesophila]|uniref:Gfo/Idh/MocA family oxidoreductase n=1 Tax=Kineosporia mesophila TaxID=566012 RepID=A0ABP6ZHF2_9ACTN|nr:Gfo/Idh/MocA family oxidoreductase [Kineosporia mesophila]MCD5350438.1 Gfo/Idh/MocA family oxidoreductase [Kineosporia mesophila]